MTCGTSGRGPFAGLSPVSSTAIERYVSLNVLTKTLRVRFLDGDSTVRQKVEQMAQQWTQFVNMTFSFGDDPDAEIRITFQGKGTSWSYIGTDNLAIPKNQATMNLGWLTLATSDAEYTRIVLHEFGHVLGFIHEHQNPVANIP